MQISEKSRDRLQALARSFFRLSFSYAFPYYFLIVFYQSIWLFFFSCGTSPFSVPLVFFSTLVNSWALSDRSLELPSNSCATTSAHLWSSALVCSSGTGFLHAPFPAFLTESRYLPILVLTTRSWPITTSLVLLSKVSPVFSARLYASSATDPLACM